MSHEVTIAAPPERVWTVFSETHAYAEWNPFFVEVAGQLRVGEKLTITMQPVGKGRQQFSPRVLSVEPGKGAVWRGRLGVPGLFDGRHTFTVERLDPHHVRFRQHEKFSGILVPFVGLKPYREGWARMDEALRRRAEEAGDGPAESAPQSPARTAAVTGCSGQTCGAR